MKKHPKANVREFTQDELSFLIRGMRAVDIGTDESLLVHMDLLEWLELELLRRFNIYVVDDNVEEAEQEAWVKCALVKLGAARKDEGQHHG